MLKLYLYGYKNHLRSSRKLAQACQVKHYKNSQACKTCHLRAQCTKNKNGRFIERSIYQEALEENKKRVENNPNYYRLRQQITEHQFGTLKRQWGFTFVL